MATPRPRLQAIRLTDAAADRIKYVMANAQQPIVGVRVGVKNGGCAGMAYTMEYAECPSSDNLRLIRHFEKGGSGSSGLEFKRPAVDAASGGLR